MALEIDNFVLGGEERLKNREKQCAKYVDEKGE